MRFYVMIIDQFMKKILDVKLIKIYTDRNEKTDRHLCLHMYIFFFLLISSLFNEILFMKFYNKKNLLLRSTKADIIR